MKRLLILTSLYLALLGQPAGAEERLLLDKTTILGNRELPKVTFVMPWGDVAAEIPQWRPQPEVRPAATPLDNELYHRQTEYARQSRHGKDGGAAK